MAFCSGLWPTKLTRAMQVSVDFKETGRLTAVQTTKDNCPLPSSYFSSQKIRNDRGGLQGLINTHLHICLTVNRPSFVQASCRHNQLLYIHSCIACVSPKGHHFAVLPVFKLVHYFLPLFYNFLSVLRKYKCLI